MNVADKKNMVRTVIDSPHYCPTEKWCGRSICASVVGPRRLGLTETVAPMQSHFVTFRYSSRIARFRTLDHLDLKFCIFIFLSLIWGSDVLVQPTSYSGLVILKPLDRPTLDIEHIEEVYTMSGNVIHFFETLSHVLPGLGSKSASVAILRETH
jgi:hypothetical protein